MWGGRGGGGREVGRWAGVGGWIRGTDHWGSSLGRNDWDSMRHECKANSRVGLFHFLFFFLHFSQANNLLFLTLKRSKITQKFVIVLQKRTFMFFSKEMHTIFNL